MLKRGLVLLLATTLALGALPICAANASNFYIIPDSNSRYLTEEELWGWQYEALGYILNEIFARHGFPFDPGGKYYNYFQLQAWYKEDLNYHNRPSGLNAIEWKNERLIKDVRIAMRKAKTTNPTGKKLPQVWDDSVRDLLDGFTLHAFTPGEKFNVYTGPGSDYLRANDGKASVSTNGNVYVGGWADGWLMVMYETNAGSVRVGCVSPTHLRKERVNAPVLRFSRETLSCVVPATLTDDPVGNSGRLAQLQAGDEVTYLSTFYNQRGTWAYVETSLGGVPVRGFIPEEALGDFVGMDASDYDFGKDSDVVVVDGDDHG